MEQFTAITAVALPLLRSNIDTDAIIPSREMKTVSKTGLADGLFAGWRYVNFGGREPDPNFVLNQPAYSGARIILAGENFGCGSSREHAVWALREYGFRAIIAPSFAPIFAGNCLRNGVLPVCLMATEIDAIAAACAPDPQHCRVEVHLPAQSVRVGDVAKSSFAIDAAAKEMLLEGLDTIDLTLKHRRSIAAFIDHDRLQRPWIYMTGIGNK